jgi:hypothetical protein
MPHMLLALDPGETTGYSFFMAGEHFANGIIDWKILTEGFNTFTAMVARFSPDVIVYENFRLNPLRANAQSGSEINTLRIIGAIEFLCNQNNIRFYKMMPSTAKGFVSDLKLKEWELYKKINPHARDSLRVAIHWLLFNKEL